MTSNGFKRFYSISRPTPIINQLAENIITVWSDGFPPRYTLVIPANYVPIGIGSNGDDADVVESIFKDVVPDEIFNSDPFFTMVFHKGLI